MCARKKTTSETIIESGIALLELLTAAPEHRVSLGEAMSTLHVSESELADIIDCISTLADSHTGSHAAISCKDGAIFLEGNAAFVGAVRLDLGESTVLAHVLSRLNIDEGVRNRAADALLPLGHMQLEDSTLGSVAVYGLHYQPLHEALSDGVRCRILYRSARQETATWRTVDPLDISYEAGNAHLVAWDVDQDGQRIYRLDRIAEVQMTDDSVDPHPFSREGASRSVAKSGVSALVIASPDMAVDQLPWAANAERHALPDGSTGLRVPVVSEPWLFDLILSSDGKLALSEPADMIDRFLDYAKSLILR